MTGTVGPSGSRVESSIVETYLFLVWDRWVVEYYDASDVVEGIVAMGG